MPDHVDWFARAQLNAPGWRDPVGPGHISAGRSSQPSSSVFPDATIPRRCTPSFPGCTRLWNIRHSLHKHYNLTTYRLTGPIRSHLSPLPYRSTGSELFPVKPPPYPQSITFEMWTTLEVRDAGNSFECDRMIDPGGEHTERPMTLGNDFALLLTVPL